MQALQAEIRYNCTGKGYGNEQCVRECFTAVVKDVVAEPSPVPAPPAGCACNTTQAPGGVVVSGGQGVGGHGVEAALALAAGQLVMAPVSLQPRGACKAQVAGA